MQSTEVYWNTFTLKYIEIHYNAMQCTELYWNTFTLKYTALKSTKIQWTAMRWNTTHCNMFTVQCTALNRTLLVHRNFSLMHCMLVLWNICEIRRGKMHTCKHNMPCIGIYVQSLAHKVISYVYSCVQVCTVCMCRVYHKHGVAILCKVGHTKW